MFESKPFKRKERMITLLAWGTVLLPVMILLFGGIKALFWCVVCVGLVALIGVIIKYPLAALLALYLGIN